MPPPPAPPPLEVPKADAAPEVWRAFYDKLGAPKTGAEYALQTPQGADPKFMTEASAWMAEAGLLPQQAKALAAKWNEYSTAQAKAHADAEAATDRAFVERTNAEKTRDLATLRVEWGPQFEAKYNDARATVQHFLVPHVKDAKALAEWLDFGAETVGYAPMMRALQAMGRNLSTGQARGLQNGGPPVGDQSLAQRMYPNAKAP